LEYAEKDFGKILKNNAQELRHSLLTEGTDCFRVYDRNLGTFPVTVDLYGLYAKITDFGEEPLNDEMRDICIDICSRMLYLEKSNVIYSYRAKRPEGQQHEKSTSQAVVTTVKEFGHSFKVDLTTYVDTGLFLDHAMTRRFVQERSQDADVLNLFSYTGSFSVYAASGLAHTVTSVDMSATYTVWAEENLRNNGFVGNNYQCICQDARAFIEQAYRENKKYDIIIFDPPSFSNSHKMDYDFDVARDYAVWIKNLFSILKKTGIILFSTNLGTFNLDKRKLRGCVIKEVTTLMWAPGFVKGRNGTVRSWIMAFDDESLSLDWSEPKKDAGKGHQQREKSSERSFDRPRKSYSDRERSYSDRPRRSYGDRDKSDRRSSDRSYSDRPRRSYGDRDRSERNYSERSYSDRPRRSYEDRDERSFERSYSDRPREDRPRRDYDKPRKSFGDRPSSEKKYGRNEWSGEKRSSSKPYGFDTFKPARSRNDSSEFFWNVEDLEKKSNKDN